MNWCDPKDWEKEFPKDTPIRCEYARHDENIFQFDAISTGIVKCGTLLVKVIRGSGHMREFNLHRGNHISGFPILESNDYWFMYSDGRAHCKISHLETAYDPNQNGDTDEDI